MFFGKWRNEVKEILRDFHSVLTEIRDNQRVTLKEIEIMSIEFDALKAEVATLGTNVAAVVAEIALLNTDKIAPADITAVTDQTAAANAALAAVIAPAPAA
jgi:hypothetical protein